MVEDFERWRSKCGALSLGGSMNVDAIRAAFIRSHLEEARQHLQEHRAIRIAREFRTYLDWHASRLPETERDLILEQLVELERNLSLTATGVHTPFRC